MPHGAKANHAAWLAVWWILRSTSLSQRDVGAVVGVSRARISQIRKQARRLAARDHAFHSIMMRLEEDLPE